MKVFLCFASRIWKQTHFESVLLTSCSFPEGWYSIVPRQCPAIPVFSPVNDVNASPPTVLLVRSLAKHTLSPIFSWAESHRLAGDASCWKVDA